MALSPDLLSQFAKVTSPKDKFKPETTVYGTVKEVDGKTYVQLDGSDLLTPVTSTAVIKPDERVTVLIKNHTATVTGNVTAPAARDVDVEEVGSKITKLEVVVADKVDTLEFNAELGRIDELVSENVVIKGQLAANEANIKELTADNATIKGELIAQEADIKNLEADKANIKDLETHYANIDFANIGEAALKKIFAESGIIKDAVFGEGYVTGELVGVTIKGDLIEGGTVKADKLVILGTDGLYYQLNTEGKAIQEPDQTIYNSLDGKVIAAKSITATKINVEDLSAFEATIGGFNITTNSLYSGVKESVDNTTRGIFMDVLSQVAVGDADRYLKYYKDDEDNYFLVLSADSIKLGATGKDVEETVNDTQNIAQEANASSILTSDRLATAELNIDGLMNQISMLVTDGNGESLMTQTESGWTFSTKEVQDSVNALMQNMDKVVNSAGSTEAAVNILQQAVNDIGKTVEYVHIGVYEDQPCIELGEDDSIFKLRITNTRIMFMEGSKCPTFIDNTGMITEDITVKNEFRHGDFAWTFRPNGNYGLIWKG